MKFTIDAKAFSAALSIAGRVIESKTPWPILSNVLIRAEAGKVTIRGTNSDITYQASVPADVEDGGEALVDFATLAKFSSVAKGATISIGAAEDAAVVKSGRGRISLAVANARDFPDYQRTSGDMVSIDPATFAKAMRFCASAVKPSEVAYHIAGVNIAEANGCIELCGTDAKIAHMSKLPHMAAIGGGGQIPIEATGIVLSIIEKAGAAKAIVNDTGWAVEADGVSAWGKVIDAKYPDLEKALSRFEWREIAIADPAEIAAAVDIAVCGTESNSDKTRHVVLRSGDGLTVRGFRAGGGVVSAGRAEADAEVRGDVALAIRADYLKATLNGLAGGGVTISASSEAIKVRPQQIDGAMVSEGIIFMLRASEAELADV